MDIRDKIILIFIVTVISLLIIIAIYYGFERYMLLRTCSDDRAKRLIEKYSGLPLASNNRTVITFASKEDHNILPTVMSLLDQTVHVDQIALNSCIKKQQSDVCLQAVNVFYVSPKIEQFRGIVPTLEREKDTRTNIIWLRDDYIYGKDFIETLVDTRKDPKQPVIAKNSKSETIGILLRPDMLKTSIVDYEKYCDQKNGDKDCNSIDGIKEYLIDDAVVIFSYDSYQL